MTPLKNWAIASFIVGSVCLVVGIFGGLRANQAWKQVREGDYIVIEPKIIDSPIGPQFTLAERSFASRKIKVQAYAWTSFTLLFGFLAFWCFMFGASLNRADNLLGDTFLRCPSCLGSNITFDVSLFKFKNRVVCRDCHALWEFGVNMLFGTLRRLRLVDPGIALREEEKNTVPKTDDPEQWRMWAKERFRTVQHPILASLPTQDQVIFCRFCGHRNLPDAKFCSACGKELRA